MKELGMGRVLLTGATGFVGRQVLRALLKRGAQVKAVVRTHDDRSGSARLDTDLAADVEVMETPDLFAESRSWWEAVLKDVDTVVHVAWYAEPGKYLHSPINLECLMGTLELAHGAVQAGVKRFVGVGTCFEYDLSACMLDVNTPLRPLSVYAGAKVATYSALSTWLPREGIGFAWCRLFYLYGEGEDERRLVPYIRRCLERGEPVKLGHGRQIRDYMDVRDAGDAIARVALSAVTGAFNVCSGEPVTIRQLAERIADEYGRRDLLHFGAMPPREGDPFCVVGVPNLPKQ